MLLILMLFSFLSGFSQSKRKNAIVFLDTILVKNLIFVNITESRGDTYYFLSLGSANLDSAKKDLSLMFNDSFLSINRSKIFIDSFESKILKLYDKYDASIVIFHSEIYKLMGLKSKKYFDNEMLKKIYPKDGYEDNFSIFKLKKAKIIRGVILREKLGEVMNESQRVRRGRKLKFITIIG